MHIKKKIPLVRKILCGMILLGVFLSAFGAGNTPPAHAHADAAKIPGGAVVSIHAAQVSFGAAEPVSLKVTITNPTAEPIGVLRWFTPAEEVTEALFLVTRDGEPVDYIGSLVKRTAPTAQDYITLRGGESLSREVDLADYYDLSTSGNYTLNYAVDSTELYAQAGQQAGSLASNRLDLYIEGRADQAPARAPALSPSGSTTFLGCSTSQQTDLVNARNAASTYAENAVAYFSANKQGARYITWFGVYDPSRYGTVSNHFSAIQNAVDNANPMHFDCTCPDISDPENVYAYVYSNQPYDIHLCGAFWPAPMTGTDSKAGVLIHEISHFQVVVPPLGTDDFVYGQTGAKNLAISNPNNAIMNADNHEYFAENTPPLEITPTFTISGNAGVAGATLTYTGGSATADGSGNYSFVVASGWSGTVTPSLSGYTFTPVNRSYTNVTANQGGQNYTATATGFTLSGNAGVAGATLTYTGGSATADGSGNYSFVVASGWSGTVTPSLSGYTFTPVNRSYTNVTANQGGQNYTATATGFTLSGNAGVAGATLTYTGGSATADGSGNYSFVVASGWSGTVTPSLSGYTFTPISRSYTNVTANQGGQNYTATATGFTLSGNAGVAGATLTYTGGSATADGSGNYSFVVASGWSGTVTPSLSGYTFTPISRSYTNVTANQGGQNYTATATGFTLSGNAGVAGATLTYTGGSATADGSGNYSFVVASGWSGTVTPSLSGYTFTPVSRSYTNVTANQGGQNYTATATGTSNLLQDPGFEAYTPNPYWEEYSTNYGTPLCTIADCGTVDGPASPRSGNVWAWFGGTPAYEQGRLSQSVIIPSGSATLQFYFWISRADAGSSTADLFSAEIDGNPVFTANATQISMYSSYTLISVDASTFADGNAHTLAFVSEINGQIVNFNLDDIALSSAPPAANFADVPPDHWAREYISRLYAAGITTGCRVDPLSFCPEEAVTRAQMAVFLERGMNGHDYSPPTATGMVFADVPLSYWAVNWIEKFYTDGITSGCGIEPLIYCPENPVTRAQMAIFLLRARHGAGYTPPDASGVFADVPVDQWAAAWIEQLAAEGITTGCGTAPLVYCPDDPVTRAQMAVFLVRTFDLP